MVFCPSAKAVVEPKSYHPSRGKVVGKDCMPMIIIAKIWSCNFVSYLENLNFHAQLFIEVTLTISGG